MALALVVVGIGEAHAHIRINVAALDAEGMRIKVDGVARTKEDGYCLASLQALYSSSPGTVRLDPFVYRQALNSEIHETASYLKAARQGRGIYVHLPYILPPRDCDSAEVVVRSRHILWDGRWIANKVRISGREAAGKSIFFTEEEDLPVVQNVYLDPAIPTASRRRLQQSMQKVIAFYRNSLEVDPMRGVGVIVTIVQNKGGYTGFGGDSLNIVRISFDNPEPQDFENLDRLFAATFAHELAHKLQNEALFSLPLGRFVAEGSADFFKVIVLHNAGITSEVEARVSVRKAFDLCQKFAGVESLVTRLRKRDLNYRAPYDCGMIYYFSAYFESAASGPAFVRFLRMAMTGTANYAPNSQSLCLLYESNCLNERLRDLGSGELHSIAAQREWFLEQLETRPLLRLGPWVGNQLDTMPEFR
ncbi:MAG: hypothetical protein U1E89_18955 [Burkholderiaceae bacterium]